MAVRKFGYFDFRNYAPVALKELNDGSITVGVASSDTAVGQWVTPAGSLLYAQVGAAGVAPGLTPVLTANGWNMPYAATNALGVEVSPARTFPMPAAIASLRLAPMRPFTCSARSSALPLLTF